MNTTTDKASEIVVASIVRRVPDGSVVGKPWKLIDAIAAFRDEAYREGVEDAAKIVCPWCGSPEYNTIWHHEEWRHYRQRDMYVEYCRAANIRNSLLPAGSVDEGEVKG